MGTKKDRNGMDLTEAEGTKKKWQKYTESESEVAQSCPTLCDPRDCSLPSSSVHGIFQAEELYKKDLRSGSELFSGSQCNLEQVTLAAGQVSTDHEAEADIQC